MPYKNRCNAMGGKCWVCKRAARGFGHTDNRYGVADPRRYPIDWVFCSRRCQNAFHALYGHWLRAEDKLNPQPKEPAMTDARDIERAAVRQCLRPFGDVAGEIGFDKPLGEYSEAEALRVIMAIVTRYTEAMVEHHEAAKYPPVRGMKPAPDPLKPSSNTSFDDMSDDIPW